jgi:hypothetical protein
MSEKSQSAANIRKPIPTAEDYSGHKPAPKGLPSPKDNFATKEPIKVTTAKVEPVKAKSHTPGVRVTDTPWEVAGLGHKPSIRTFAGSTTSRGGKPARASK